MRPRRKLYGWRHGKEWRLSREPPDGPSAYQAFDSIEDTEAAAQGARYDVVWCGDALAERERLRALEAAR